MTDTAELRRRLDLLDTALERRSTFGGPDVLLDSSVRHCARELVTYLRAALNAEDAERERRKA